MSSNDITIDTLNRLIETCKDGEYGFRASSEHAKNADLQEIFMRRSEECRRAAAELHVLVTKLGGSAAESGSVGGAAHRGWVAVKGNLAGYSDLAILEDCERGEDSAMAAYRKALDADNLSVEARTLVERQYDGVKHNHAQVRALRHEVRSAQR